MPKEATRINRTDDYDDAVHDLGDTVLIESELELKLYYYEDLAMRQKKAARQMKRRDLVSYYLNMSDHFNSLANAEMMREEIRENEIRYQRTMRDVKACHVPTSEEAIAYTKMKMHEAEEEEEDAEDVDDVDGAEDVNEGDDWPESDEVLAGDTPEGEAPKDDPFVDSDKPVNLDPGTKAVLENKEPVIDDAS